MIHARIDEVSIKDLGRKEEPNEKMVTLVKVKQKGRKERRGLETRKEREKNEKREEPVRKQNQ